MGEMMIDKSLLKQEKESDFDHIKRIVYGKLVYKTIDADYEELSELLFGEGNNFNSSEVRKRCYGLKRLLDILETNKVENITDEDILNELQLKTVELRQEKVKLQLEKVELNRWIRHSGRLELLIERMESSIANLSPVSNIPLVIKKEPATKKGILGIADVHYGKKLLLKGLRGEVINEYNAEIFEKRMWCLLDKTVKIIEKEKLDTLNVVLLGDLIDGILRMHSLITAEMPMVDSIMKFSEFMATWLNKLSEYVRINLYSVLGNHAEFRNLSSKKGEFAEENAEKLIVWYIRSRLLQNKNIVVNDVGTACQFKVFDKNILAVHGQDENNLENSVKDYSMMYGEKINILLSGHLHGKHGKDVHIDAEFIQFPSIIGSDEYSWKIHKTSNPATKLIVLEEGKDKTTYDIVLR